MPKSRPLTNHQNRPPKRHGDMPGRIVRRVQRTSEKQSLEQFLIVSTLIGIASRPTSLSPLLRSLAAVTLVVWLAAQMLCTAHCNFGLCHGEAEHAACHDSAQPQAHHDHEDSPAPAHDDSSTTAACLTLESALVGDSVPAMIPPELHLLYSLAPVVLALNATATEPAAPSLRRARRDNWVLTPEVSLGPAHRSHAPPVPL